jgi:hypothetical protein
MNRLLLSVLAVCALPSALAQVRITPGLQKINVEINGKSFTDFYIGGPEVTKPYLHPLRAASGTYVTRMWPMENVEEEKTIRKDHPHQRGLWFAHESVNKLDFWNNEASYKTPNRGKIVLKKLDAVKDGAKSGTIAATFDWTDLEGKAVLVESRVMTFYAEPELRTIDFDIALTAAGPVTFGDSKDGAFGVRMRPVLQEQGGTGHITNADGLAGEKQLWGKASNWCDYSGEAQGEKVGIAILDHPQNPRHPVRWHVRGYGLFAANPFGLAVFTGDKSQNGDMTLASGEKVRFRYRVVIHPGDAKSANLAQAWERYAAGK